MGYQRVVLCVFHVKWNKNPVFSSFFEIKAFLLGNNYTSWPYCGFMFLALTGALLIVIVYPLSSRIWIQVDEFFFLKKKPGWCKLMCERTWMFCLIHHH